jgi:aldehyde dehydrogenase family 7 protein A1
MLLSRIRTNALRQARFKTSAPLSTRAAKILSALDLPTEYAQIPGVYDGEWRGSGDPLYCYCPSTGEHLGEVMSVSE